MARRGSQSPGHKVKMLAENRKARHNFEILERFEAGIQLEGTEVKSLRQQSANIAESYAEVKDDELWLINSHISEFTHGNRFNHEPRRPRKLLMHRREINKFFAATQREGLTVVPLAMYFNEQNKIKVELGLARGKKAHDKRETEKKRDWDRQKQRLLREKG